MKIKLKHLKEIIREELLTELGEITTVSPYTPNPPEIEELRDSKSNLSARYIYQTYNFTNLAGNKYIMSIDLSVDETPGSILEKRSPKEFGIMTAAFRIEDKNYDDIADDEYWRNTMSTVTAILLEFYNKYKDEFRIKGLAYTPAGSGRKAVAREKLYLHYIMKNIDIANMDFGGSTKYYYINNEYYHNSPSAKK